MKQEILTIQARLKETNELIWASGIEDSYTFVQPIIPSKYVTETDHVKIEPRLLLGNPEYINLGEQEAKDHYEDWTLFTLKIVYIEIE